MLREAAVKKISIFICLVLLFSFCQAGLIMLKSGDVYDAEYVDPNYSDTHMAAFDGKDVILIEKKNIKSFFDMKPLPEGGIKGVPKPPVKGETIPVPVQKAKVNKEIELKKTDADNKDSKKGFEMQKTEKRPPDDQIGLSFAINPFAEEISGRYRFTDDFSLDFMIGADILPDNIEIYSENAAEAPREGQYFKTALSAVFALIQNDDTRANLLTGFGGSYHRIHDKDMDYNSFSIDIRVTVAAFLGIELEWIPSRLGKNLAICSAAGIGVQYVGESHYFDGEHIKPTVSSMVVNVSSDFTFKPLYLRYYF
jgi:hypothetical protein